MTSFELVRIVRKMRLNPHEAIERYDELLEIAASEALLKFEKKNKAQFS